MGSGNRHTLGAVDGRAAAHGDQSITPVGFVGLHRSAHGGFGGVGRRLIEHGHGQAGQGVQGFLQNACRLYARIRHDQGPRDAYALAFLL